MDSQPQTMVGIVVPTERSVFYSNRVNGTHSSSEPPNGVVRGSTDTWLVWHQDATLTWKNVPLKHLEVRFFHLKSVLL